MKKVGLPILLGIWLAWSCHLVAGAQQLGPVDGQNFPATDLERIVVGTKAPDFILSDLKGQKVQLSRVRKDANVVLVFFRGHW